MAKKVFGIISLALGGILLLIYVINWVVENPYDYDEATISIQEGYISSREYYISQCEDAIDEVEEYQWIYGWDSVTDALIDRYEDMISEARSDIRDARNTIISAENNIARQRTIGIVILLAGIAAVVTGIVLLATYSQSLDVDNLEEEEEIEGYSNSVSYENTNVSSDTNTSNGWVCPNCGRTNPNYVGSCGCGVSKY